MLDLTFIEWLKAKIESYSEFLGQMSSKAYEGEDEEIDIAHLEGELKAYKTVLKHLEEDGKPA